MTFARALPMLLLAAAAPLDGQEDCTTEFPGDVIVRCDGITEFECRRQARERWDATGRQCCSGYRERNQCSGSDPATFPTRCQTGCVEIPVSVSVGAGTARLMLDRAWGQYSGTTALTWTGGSGASVTLVMAEFAPSSGPTLAAGDLRARTTAGLSDWTALGSATSYTVVPTSSTPGTVTVSWAVRDRPSYSTGAYSATAVFTIAEP